jgi:hypothetical protein
MWQEAIKSIDKWGCSAVNQANIKARKQFETSVCNNKPGAVEPVQY